ncbi:MAG: VOC family protein [Pirellulales bacterium]
MPCCARQTVTADWSFRVFLAPTVVADHRTAPVNALGYLRVMFAVEDLDDTLARLKKRGAEVVDQVVRYQDAYRLCYIRGPEGILIGLAQELEKPAIW